MKWHNKIPKTVKVGSSVITIKLIPYRTATHSNIFGQYIAEDEIIELDDGLTENFVRRTLLHEIMHAIWHDQCMSNVNDISNNNREEFIVDNMSKGLRAVFVNNPDVAKFLIQK